MNAFSKGEIAGPRDAVRPYRASASALRGVAYRQGTTAATTDTVERHTRAQTAAVAYLVAAGRRNVAGWLTEEAGLAGRLRGVPAGRRPELRNRLAAARRQLARVA